MVAILSGPVYIFFDSRVFLLLNETESSFTTQKKKGGRSGGSVSAQKVFGMTAALAKKTIFTTGQVAKVCKVAPRTVSKWFDSGRLRGYRIPGSQDRRIPREHLIRFLKEHGMPLGELEDEAMGKVLIVGTDPVVRGSLNEMLGSDEFTLETAQSGFEAGIQAESMRPHCIVIDFAMGRSDALMIAGNLRKNPEYAETVLIGLLSDEDNASGFDRTIFNETFRKPFDVALLAERMRTLVGRKTQLL